MEQPIRGKDSSKCERCMFTSGGGKLCPLTSKPSHASCGWDSKEYERRNNLPLLLDTSINLRRKYIGDEIPAHFVQPGSQSTPTTAAPVNEAALDDKAPESSEETKKKTSKWVATEKYMVDRCDNCGSEMAWEDIPDWLEALPNFRNTCPSCGYQMEPSKTEQEKKQEDKPKQRRRKGPIELGSANAANNTPAATEEKSTSEEATIKRTRKKKTDDDEKVLREKDITQTPTRGRRKKEPA